MAESKFIPDGIVADIFSRLPCKSLLRFKSGCQSWYSLISHPNFITLHFYRSVQNPKLFFNSKQLYFRLFDFKRSSVKTFYCSFLQFPLETHKCSDLTILGSSCGLVCVARRSPIEFYLWNPFTRELRNIPHPEPKYDRWHYASYAHGLGYDPVSNNLKLFMPPYHSYTCKVFCMKSNSWRSIRCPDKLNSRRYPLVDPRAVVVNGVFHWLINVPWRSFEIIGYDSTKHRFLEVAMPPVDVRYLFDHACLLKHEGLLCISFGKRYVEEIWKLKNHSWVHVLRVSTLYPLKSRSSLYRPIYIYGRNRVILYNEDDILRSTEGVKKTEKIGPHSPSIHEGITCFETLISPNHIILKK